jgi:hypothetical protein
MHTLTLSVRQAEAQERAHTAAYAESQSAGGGVHALPGAQEYADMHSHASARAQDGGRMDAARRHCALLDELRGTHLGFRG